MSKISDVIVGSIISHILLEYFTKDKKENNKDDNKQIEQDLFDKHCDVIKDIMCDAVNQQEMGIKLEKEKLKINDVISFCVNAMKKMLSDNTDLSKELDNTKKDLKEKTEMLSDLLLGKEKKNNK